MLVLLLVIVIEPRAKLVERDSVESGRRSAAETTSSPWVDGVSPYQSDIDSEHEFRLETGVIS